METINQSPVTQPEQVPKIQPAVKSQEVQKLTEFMTTLRPQTKLLIGVAGVLISAVIVLFLFLPRRTAPAVVVPSVPPVSTVSASLAPRETSAFAKTDAFKQFDMDVVNFQNSNNSVDVSETLLSFPLLDMKVNFNK